MSSRKCCLRQHNRLEAANLKFIDLSLESLDDTVLKYLLRGPNLFEVHVEEDCKLYHITTSDLNPGPWQYYVSFDHFLST